MYRHFYLSLLDLASIRLPAMDAWTENGGWHIEVNDWQGLPSLVCGGDLIVLDSW
jgi:hypothetical protein